MAWEIFIGPYRTYSGVRRYNIYPFKTILLFLTYRSKFDFMALFINLAANVITFIPLGFLAPMLFKKLDKLIIMVLFSVFLITGLEALQFVLNVGVFDVDDIILNTIGCVLGFFMNKAAKRVLAKYL
jgi:Glycopeptide antibiotics resistance protein